MQTLTPTDAWEFADAYGAAYAAGNRIRVCGNNTKWRFAGPVRQADVAIDTKALSAVHEYDPRDLTISVGAGMPYRTLRETLAAQGQMVPLDPPFEEEATVGGVVATNLCGPRRRAYGTARDYVIGLQFVDHQGRLVQSGAMVAKNVAGYDLNKLFVGSWGSLGPIVRVNLRVSPLPKHSTTFLIQKRAETEYHELRDRLLRSFAEPIAIDYVNSNAGERLRLNGSALLIRYSNPSAVVERLRTLHDLPEPVDAELEPFLWLRFREWAASELMGRSEGSLLQLSSSHSKLFRDVSSLGGRVLARAGSGVLYAVFPDSDTAISTMQFLEAQGRTAQILSASDETRETQKLWAGKQSDFALMKRVKSHFDPTGLVNTGRLHGCF